jgi:hypothetical protein
LQAAAARIVQKRQFFASENRYMNLKMKRPLDFHIPDGLLGFAVQFSLSQAGF